MLNNTNEYSDLESDQQISQNRSLYNGDINSQVQYSSYTSESSDIDALSAFQMSENYTNFFAEIKNQINYTIEELTKQVNNNDLLMQCATEFERYTKTNDFQNVSSLDYQNISSTDYQNISSPEIGNSSAFEFFDNRIFLDRPEEMLHPAKINPGMFFFIYH